MSILVELQERVEKTNALIAQCERTIATAGVAPPLSVLASVRSLEKLRQRLEAQFYEVADSQELEVYRYRMLTADGTRPTLAGVANAWSAFQTLFGSVYSALTKSPKRTKKPSQPQALELGYGYSFASSVGVVVTVPRDIGIYAASPLDEASTTVFDLIEAKNLKQVAKHLGPEPIKAFHEWIDLHARHQAGIGLEWRSAQTVRRSVEVQYQSLTELQRAIVDTTIETGLDVSGELVAVNCETKEFKLRGDDDCEYAGHFGEAITEEHAASVPARYRARIIQTTKIVITGQKPQTTFFLESLDPL